MVCPAKHPILSLQSVRNAAPKVAAFLHGNNDLFARIVDAIIENTAREKGLLPSVQRAVDQLVLIWTEQSKRKQSNEDNDQEIDPNVFNNLPYLAGQRNTLRTPMLRAISPSTPAAVLCRLLAPMTQLRRYGIMDQLEVSPRKNVEVGARVTVNLEGEVKHM